MQRRPSPMWARYGLPGKGAEVRDGNQLIGRLGEEQVANGHVHGARERFD